MVTLQLRLFWSDRVLLLSENFIWKVTVWTQIMWEKNTNSTLRAVCVLNTADCSDSNITDTENSCYWGFSALSPIVVLFNWGSVLFSYSLGLSIVLNPVFIRIAVNFAFSWGFTGGFSVMHTFMCNILSIACAHTQIFPFYLD